MTWLVLLLLCLTFHALLWDLVGAECLASQGVDFSQVSLPHVWILPFVSFFFVLWIVLAQLGLHPGAIGVKYGLSSTHSRVLLPSWQAPDPRFLVIWQWECCLSTRKFWLEMYCSGAIRYFLHTGTICFQNLCIPHVSSATFCFHLDTAILDQVPCRYFVIFCSAHFSFGLRIFKASYQACLWIGSAGNEK